MILTQCAVCATELGLSLGKKCGRCSTRYCGPECQVQHWKDGGHDKLCKILKKAGGAEQYNANKKYAEALAVAVAKCADDTKGQTCYICTQAVHWKTKEGLVRMCACRGTAGFAHVSCLAEQAEILVADAEERHLDDDQWARWSTCSLCGQDYHGVVFCALGWACWKTYVGRPEADAFRSCAMGGLGQGLEAAKNDEDALTVREAHLVMQRRTGRSEESILITQANIASSYQNLRRFEDALRLKQNIYSTKLRLYGEEHSETLTSAINYATLLVDLQRDEEARSLMLKTTPVARRTLGEGHITTLRMSWIYAEALYKYDGATLDDFREAVTTFEDTARIARRVLGGAHPVTVGIERELLKSRAVLRARETGDVSSLREAMEAMTSGDA